MLRFILTLFLTALLTCCTAELKQADNTVNASNYDAFWLWAGVKPQPVLDDAKTIYLLAGEIRAGANQQIVPLRAVPAVQHADVWLVLRVETLNWAPSQYKQLDGLIDRWQNGNKLVGVQIDFDANTQNLDNYAEFLGEIRKQLPKQYKLGITGLMDWSANGDPKHLERLSDVVDEAVFQVYQGRKTIPGYERWLKNLGELPMPYRIGLVQNGEWQAPESLNLNPNFKGYVVFLLNPAK